ncbi:glycosyltransferase family 4 protein [Yoonia sp. 2307UL14-13]|uniref:glycosyltransferase family 4 protein n=1 Tax=Yoonia sp. 2307UL14-13 TaxID=3126506 RepID=UPI00309E773D
MKIALVTPSWPGIGHANGITTSVVNLVDGLEALGHEVTIIPLSPAQEPDPRCIDLPLARNATILERVTERLDLADPTHIRYAESIAAAGRIAIEQRQIDVLIMEETQGWAAIVQKMLPVPVIVTLHGPWFLQTALEDYKTTRHDVRRLKREATAFRTCAGMTVPSRDVLDKTVAQVPSVVDKRIVLHNSIQLKDAVDQAALTDKQRRSILFVGRNDRRKGADVLLEGFTTLVEGGDDVHLTFVGPDPGMEQPDGSTLSITQVLGALPEKVQDRISYLGLQSKEQIDTLRHQHGVTVIASRYETFPYVVLEALASGSATISAAGGGPKEIIRDSETGLLIPVEDSGALAAAVRRILADPALAASLGQAGRTDIETRFSPRAIAQQLVTFAEDVRAGFRS